MRDTETWISFHARRKARKAQTIQEQQHTDVMEGSCQVVLGLGRGTSRASVLVNECESLREQSVSRVLWNRGIKPAPGTDLSDLVLPVVRLARHCTLDVCRRERQVDERLCLVEFVSAQEVDCFRQNVVSTTLSH